MRRIVLVGLSVGAVALLALTPGVWAQTGEPTQSGSEETVSTQDGGWEPAWEENIAEGAQGQAQAPVAQGRIDGDPQQEAQSSQEPIAVPIGAPPASEMGSN